MKIIPKGQFQFVWRKAEAQHTWHKKRIQADTPEQAVERFAEHLRKGPAKASMAHVVVDHLFLQGTGTDDPGRVSLRNYAHPFSYDYANVVYPPPK